MHQLAIVYFPLYNITWNGIRSLISHLTGVNAFLRHKVVNRIKKGFAFLAFRSTQNVRTYVILSLILLLLLLLFVRPEFRILLKKMGHTYDYNLNVFP